MLLKLNMRAICLYERLSSQSYNALVDTDELSMQTLLYAMYLEGDKVQGCPSFHDFQQMLLDEGFIQSLAQEATQIFLQQQSFAKPEAPQQDNARERQGSSTVPMISPLVARLIAEGGLSAQYVMQQMPLWEMDLHIQALEARKKEELEQQRLWTFYAVAPHVGGDFKQPKDLLEFPWEAEATRAQREAEAALQDMAFLAITNRITKE